MSRPDRSYIYLLFQVRLVHPFIVIYVFEVYTYIYYIANK